VSGRGGFDYRLPGGVKVVIDGEINRVEGMQRGGRHDDPRDPLLVKAQLPDGTVLDRPAQLVAWDGQARCWVYVAEPW
jgi:hypothetical protein